MNWRSIVVSAFMGVVIALGVGACSQPSAVDTQACEELDYLKENFPEKDPPKDLVAECT